MSEDLPIDPVPLGSVRLDGGTQSRTAINEAAVADYAEALRNGVALPPVVLFFDGVHFWLADGFHRYHACLANGSDQILAHVHTGSRREAVLYAVGANAGHGLRRTNEDKRRAVMMLLEDAEWAAWSDNAIAKACHVDHKTVAAARATILGSSQDAPTRTVTRNGTTYQQKVKAKKTTVPAKPAPAVPVIETTTYSDGTVATGPAPLPPDSPAKDDGDLAALRAENAALREQMAELADMFEGTLADNQAMGKIVDADDKLAEATRLLKQAQELNRVLETRLLGLTNEKNELMRRYKGAQTEITRLKKGRADAAA